jgi:hypothetical protein
LNLCPRLDVPWPDLRVLSCVWRQLVELVAADMLKRAMLEEYDPLSRTQTENAVAMVHQLLIYEPGKKVGTREDLCMFCPGLGGRIGPVGGNALGENACTEAW